MIQQYIIEIGVDYIGQGATDEAFYGSYGDGNGWGCAEGSVFYNGNGVGLPNGRGDGDLWNGTDAQ